MEHERRRQPESPPPLQRPFLFGQLPLQQKHYRRGDGQPPVLWRLQVAPASDQAVRQVRHGGGLEVVQLVDRVYAA